MHSLQPYFIHMTAEKAAKFNFILSLALIWKLWLESYHVTYILVLLAMSVCQIHSKSAKLKLKTSHISIHNNVINSSPYTLIRNRIFDMKYWAFRIVFCVVFHRCGFESKWHTQNEGMVKIIRDESRKKYNRHELESGKWRKKPRFTFNSMLHDFDTVDSNLPEQRFQLRCFQW